MKHSLEKMSLNVMFRHFFYYFHSCVTGIKNFFECHSRSDGAFPLENNSDLTDDPCRRGKGRDFTSDKMRGKYSNLIHRLGW